MKYESKNREQPIRLRKVSICRNLMKMFLHIEISF